MYWCIDFDLFKYITAIKCECNVTFPTSKNMYIQFCSTLFSMLIRTLNSHISVWGALAWHRLQTGGQGGSIQVCMVTEWATVFYEYSLSLLSSFEPSSSTDCATVATHKWVWKVISRNCQASTLWIKSYAGGVRPGPPSPGQCVSGGLGVAWRHPHYVPWDDNKAYSEVLVGTAAACGWPEAEWADLLLPILTGEALTAVHGLWVVAGGCDMAVKHELLDRLGLAAIQGWCGWWI